MTEELLRLVTLYGYLTDELKVTHCLQDDEEIDKLSREVEELEGTLGISWGATGARLSDD